MSLMYRLLFLSLFLSFVVRFWLLLCAFYYYGIFNSPIFLLLLVLLKIKSQYKVSFMKLTKQKKSDTYCSSIVCINIYIVEVKVRERNKSIKIKTIIKLRNEIVIFTILKFLKPKHINPFVCV